MACDHLLTYPDFNETFKIHNNASALERLSAIKENLSLSTVGKLLMPNIGIK